MYLKKIYAEDEPQTHIESGFIAYFRHDEVANSGGHTG